MSVNPEPAGCLLSIRQRLKGSRCVHAPLQYRRALPNGKTRTPSILKCSREEPLGSSCPGTPVVPHTDPTPRSTLVLGSWGPDSGRERPPTPPKVATSLWHGDTAHSLQKIRGRRRVHLVGLSDQHLGLSTKTRGATKDVRGQGPGEGTLVVHGREMGEVV